MLNNKHDTAVQIHIYVSMLWQLLHAFDSLSRCFSFMSELTDQTSNPTQVGATQVHLHLYVVHIVIAKKNCFEIQNQASNSQSP